MATTPYASFHAAPSSPVMQYTQSEGQPAEGIPRRLMRVKVLYTFDDQNKSNCLARLPNALSIPTVPLDEDTQIGVIELKTCIQAVVAASPELVAKLGHDYTVYAYDYSEYETPLVGQGMLSWLLASASATPNAPAEQSQTMVTGRVCNNILGLFSNGIKETLEVKLRLVPVPTSMQREYVENMERYHNLSKAVPQDLSDYNAWTEFLKANPTIRQLAQPVPVTSLQASDRRYSSGVDSFPDMQTPQAPGEDRKQSDYTWRYCNPHTTRPSNDTRASSPAISIASYQRHPPQRDSEHASQYVQDLNQGTPPRPASQASFRSEPASQLKHPLPYTNTGEEDGPPKKRAHISKAERPKKDTALYPNTDSLRVTASVAASVRNVRSNSHLPGLDHAKELPRAPTPRPTGILRCDRCRRIKKKCHNEGLGTVCQNCSKQPPGKRREVCEYLDDFGKPIVPSRTPAPSLTRHASMDAGSNPYGLSYETGTMSDIAAESGDEGKGRSPMETPMTLPSSPPPMPRRTVSPARSSPELPSLPPPPPSNDSGFVSDLSTTNEGVSTQEKIVAEREVVAVPKPKPRKKADNSKRKWNELVPGPPELLPRSYTPQPNPNGPYGRPRPVSSTLAPRNHGVNDTASLEPNAIASEDFMRSFQDHLNSSTSEGNGPTSTHPPPHAPVSQGLSVAPQNKPGSLDSNVLPTSHNTNNDPRKEGLSRSHTWSGGELITDLHGKPSKRPQRNYIQTKLQKALDAGDMPQYCHNCGQIDTPAWRRAFTRIQEDIPKDLQLSSKGNSITAYQVVEDDAANSKYRIFKMSLNDDERVAETYTPLVLCNPCGLYLQKNHALRPSELFQRAEETKETKRRRKAARLNASMQSRSDIDGMMSDAPNHNSEANVQDSQDPSETPASLDGLVEEEPNKTLPERSASAGAGQDGNDLPGSAAQAALLRAIRSSPAGLVGHKNSIIYKDADLTPKPTRRLLFPSPRQHGEKKLLSDNRPCQLSRAQTTPTKGTQTGTPEFGLEEVDKENCPPSELDDHHELSNLFGESPSPKTTHVSEPSESLAKTPTPTSRHNPLTPRPGADCVDRITPGRVSRTPRTGKRTVTLAPETPFTRQLNELLSEGMLSSPSRAIDFSDFSIFPTFATPGRNTNGAPFSDILTGEFSSDFPVPSSPPMTLGFSVFEDPTASTPNLWNSTGVFDGNEIMLGHNEGGVQNGVQGFNPDSNLFGMQGMSADFEVLIAQVAGAQDKSSNEQTANDKEQVEQNGTVEATTNKSTTSHEAHKLVTPEKPDKST
ncbi:unnamed protein product [Periconia digitata]|uniref:GATA-type domain-containing protein n=1 Tax=Periconia digitata TaxID=1303443 RepID=A0A9W4UD26_9PLEO|nr:unnamed protein product [Periconia digitata]